MPRGVEVLFSSLKDPVDVARAQAALDSAWDLIEPTLAEGIDRVEERCRLASIVVDFIGLADDEDDLMRRAVERFRKTQ